MTYDNPSDPYGGPFTPDEATPAPTKLDADTVRRARRALAAAKRILDCAPRHGAHTLFDDAYAMSQVIRAFADHVTKLLSHQDDGDETAPLLGSVFLRMATDFDTAAQEEIKALLVEDLGLTDVVARMEAAAAKIFHGESPRVVGVAPDDDDDEDDDTEDDLTEDERREQLEGTVDLLCQALVEQTGIQLKIEQGTKVVLRFWALIDACNENVEAVAKETKARNAEMFADMKTMPIRTITNRVYRQMVLDIVADDEDDLDEIELSARIGKAAFRYATADLTVEQLDRMQSYMKHPSFAHALHQIGRRSAVNVVEELRSTPPLT